jgi:hypothetical protein
MKLEDVQNALFAAYDISNAMTSADRRRPTENAPMGESLQDVIDFLISLETKIVNGETV